MKDCVCYPRLYSMTQDERDAMKAMRISIGVHAMWCPMYVERRTNKRVAQLESLR